MSNVAWFYLFSTLFYRGRKANIKRNQKRIEKLIQQHEEERLGLRAAAVERKEAAAEIKELDEEAGLLLARSGKVCEGGRGEEKTQYCNDDVEK